MNRAKRKALSHARHARRCNAMRSFGINPAEAWKYRQSTPGTPSHDKWLKWSTRNAE